jgi:hypothetical protein
MAGGTKLKDLVELAATSLEGCVVCRELMADIERTDVARRSTGLFDCAPPPPFPRRSAANDRVEKLLLPETICEICAICGCHSGSSTRVVTHQKSRARF